MERPLRLLRLSIAQGGSEEWTKLYLAYIEGAPQLPTSCNAKNACGVLGSAKKQASVAQEL